MANRVLYIDDSGTKEYASDLIENIRAAFSEVFDVADDVAAAIKRELKILETGGKG